MKLELTVEGLTINEVLAKQKALVAKGSNVEVTIGDGGVCVLTWLVNNEDPIALIDSMDDMAKRFSLDIMDNFDCVDVDSVRYLDADHMCGCRDFLHTPNEI